MQGAFYRLGIGFQRDIINAFNESDIDKIYRIAMLNSVEWEEIKTIPNGKFICVSEGLDEDGFELNYWVTNEELDIALE